LTSQRSIISGNVPTGLEQAYQFCIALIRRFEVDIDEYKVGEGPIERLFEIYQDHKEIIFEAAMELVRWPGFHSFLSSVYIRRISLAAQAKAFANDWRTAVKLQRLVLAAVNSRTPDDETFEMRIHATLSWLEIATLALIDVPDGRLHREAASEADRLIRDAAVRGDKPLQAHTRYMLGVLHLDPYIVGRTNVGFPEQFVEWKQRLEQEVEPVTRARHDADLQMAAPDESFRTAIELLEEAASDQGGRDRGVALKKLADAMFWLEVVGGGLDLGRFGEVTAASIKLLDPSLDQTLISELAFYRNAKKLPIDEGGSSSPAPEFIDHVLVSTGDDLQKLASNPLGLVNTLVAAASSVVDQNPQRAMAIYRKSWDVCRLFVSFDNAKLTNLTNGLKLLRRAYRHDKLEVGNFTDSFSALQDLYTRGRVEHWHRDELAAAIIALIIFVADANSGHALTMLADAEKAYREDTQFFLENVHLLNFLRLKLHIDIANNAEESGDYHSVWQHYVAVWDGFLLFGFHDLETWVLARIAAVIQCLSPQELAGFVTQFVSRALAGQGEVSTRRDEAVLSICRGVTARTMELGQENLNTSLIFLVWQIAKGLRFATALGRWTYNWESDEIGLTILQRIKEIAASIGRSTPAELFGSPTSPLSEDLLLSAYIPADPETSGVGAEAQMNNLMRRYDAQVTSNLLNNVQPGHLLDVASYLVNYDEMEHWVGPRTVLAIQYLGRTKDSDLVLNTMIITDEELYICNDLIAYPKDSGLFVEVNKKFTYLDFIGSMSAIMRSCIKEDPKDNKVVSQEAIKYLKYCKELLFLSSDSVLKQLHARGKDHLCVVPHGALHFMPVHLLGPEGHPLAEQWIVTSLRNLAMLKKGPGSVSMRAKEMAAFGLRFGRRRPHKLKAIPGAIDEARRIATLFGVEPQLDDKATKRALFHALEQARFVHLATHGNHNVAAPSFQCLYMTPDDRSDGIVNAYEVLNLDLRGLEVVSLSACETALGRFDNADNLRGFPANLFIRGARTIVGTLWEVETEAAVRFFTSFYSRLRDGTSKLDAFGGAQSETRKLHPQYRDWGAFYLLGHWGRPDEEN
jgi:hypothetical protein